MTNKPMTLEQIGDELLLLDLHEKADGKTILNNLARLLAADKVIEAADQWESQIGSDASVRAMRVALAAWREANK